VYFEAQLQTTEQTRLSSELHELKDHIALHELTSFPLSDYSSLSTSILALEAKNFSRYWLFQTAALAGFFLLMGIAFSFIILRWCTAMTKREKLAHDLKGRAASLALALEDGVRDVALAKEAADVIQARLDKWEIAVSGAGTGIWNWNIETNKLVLSDTIFFMLGYPAPSAMVEVDASEFFLNWIYPEDRGMALKEWSRASKITQSVHQIELRLCCQDGSYLWVAIRGAPIPSARELPLRAAGSITDISEQRFARDQVEDRNAQLNTMFTLSPDGYVVFDHDGYVKYHNPAFLSVTDWTDSALIGLNEAAFLTALNCLCIKGRKLESLADYGQTGWSSDKSILIDIASSPPKVIELRMRANLSATVSKILYLRDVTHETILESMKTNFLATAAHELRSPMAGIMGFSELLLARHLNEQDTREFLTIIHGNSVRMANILDDLLDLARIESGRSLKTTFKALDLSEVVTLAISSFALPADRRPPVVNFYGNVTRIWSDADKTHQVLLNLLSNAYKYSPVGSDIEVTFAEQRTDASGALVGVTIRDHGVGMSPASVQRVCERFFRANKSGDVPGSGLGMSIVKEIMTLLEGTLNIESTLGVGTVVTVLFPVPSKDARA
jgi:signal transduction histidine kinase